ncbi:MAG: hypothetical protein ACRD2T_09665, partial [Thermoanaerobaculia bacterium]
MASLFLSAAPLGAVDFIRGDANGDGVISVADAVFTVNYNSRGGPFPECEKAADFDDSGWASLGDVVQLMNFVILSEGAPAPPYPERGPDPTEDTLPCDGYGNGSLLEDPAAEMRLLDAVAPGGADRRALLTVALSGSHRLRGYQGVIVDSAGLVADSGAAFTHKPGFGVGLEDLMNFHPLGIGLARKEEDRIHIGYHLIFSEGMPDYTIPDGDEIAVITIPVCLKPGVPAGVYPFALEAGELADEKSGRAIRPALSGGQLTVLSAVEETTCATVFKRPRVNAAFKLEERTAKPGETVAVPFVVRTDAAAYAFQFSVDFDETRLVATEIDKVWGGANGEIYQRATFEFDNRDEHPGSAGMDEGYLYGSGRMHYSEPGTWIPANTDVTVLRFHLRVKADAPAGPTDLRFLHRPESVGGPDGHPGTENSLVAGGHTYNPSLDSSFLLVNARINIVPDGTPFVRGDANDDGAVDISDPSLLLSHLFLAGEEPRCADAADADDDGRVDISDPIFTLQWLFTGGRAPPAPGPDIAGHDPTEDLAICFE